MNFQFYLEKLLNSNEFLKFKKENPTAFLCSGFFAIDKKSSKSKENQQHLDYYIPELNKMFSIKLNENPVEIISVENFGYTNNEENTKIQKLSDNIDFNFEELEKLIENKMTEENINKKIEKLLWSLQPNPEKEKNEFLIGTVFISNLGMLKVSYDLQEKKIVDFQKKSFMDFLKFSKK